MMYFLLFHSLINGLISALDLRFKAENHPCCNFIVRHRVWRWSYTFTHTQNLKTWTLAVKAAVLLTLTYKFYITVAPNLQNAIDLQHDSFPSRSFSDLFTNQNRGFLPDVCVWDRNRLLAIFIICREVVTSVYVVQINQYDCSCWTYRIINAECVKHHFINRAATNKCFQCRFICRLFSKCQIKSNKTILISFPESKVMSSSCNQQMSLKRFIDYWRIVAALFKALNLSSSYVRDNDTNDWLQ